MLSMEEREAIVLQATPMMQTMRIIVGALAAGPTFFAIYLLVIAKPEQAESYTTSIAMAAIALASLPAWFLVPRMITQAQVSNLARGIPEGDPKAIYREDVKQLLNLYQTKLIIACALLEGAAFANLTGYLIEGRVFSLAIAVVLIVGVLAHMPTEGRLLSWMEMRLEELQSNRGMR